MNSKNYINGLTPLRGIGALLVVFGHYQLNFYYLDIMKLTSHKLYLLVDLFFILSGFVLLLGYGKNFEKEVDAKAYKKFIIARLLRIYPLHIFTLIALFVIGFAKILVINHNNYISSFNFLGSEGQYSLATFISNILLIQSWAIHSTFSWNGPAWSLSAEWAAYLLFPWLAIYYSRIKMPETIIILAVCSIIYIILYDIRKDESDMTYNYGVIRCLVSFCTGMSLYKIFMLDKVKDSFLKKDLTFLIIAIAVVYCFCVKASDLIIIPLLWALILVTSCNKERMAKVLDNSLLQYLGNISYSIYLMHMVVLITVLGFVKTLTGLEATDFPLWQNTLLLVVCFSLTMVSSHFSYIYVEVAFPKAVKSWLDSRAYAKIAKTNLALVTVSEKGEEIRLREAA